MHRHALDALRCLIRLTSTYSLLTKERPSTEIGHAYTSLRVLPDGFPELPIPGRCLPDSAVFEGALRDLKRHWSAKGRGRG